MRDSYQWQLNQLVISWRNLSSILKWWRLIVCDIDMMIFSILCLYNLFIYWNLTSGKYYIASLTYSLFKYYSWRIYLYWNSIQWSIRLSTLMTLLISVSHYFSMTRDLNWYYCSFSVWQYWYNILLIMADNILPIVILFGVLIVNVYWNVWLSRNISNEVINVL